MKNLKEIGHALKVARTAAKLTQEDLGDILGLRHQTIGNWERGAVIHEKWWDALKRAIGIDIESLARENAAIIAQEHSIAAGRDNSGDNNCIKGVVLSPEEQSLVNALRRLGDRKETVILELLGIVAKELKS